MVVAACGAILVFNPSATSAGCTQYSSLDVQIQSDAEHNYFLIFKWTNPGPDRVRVYLREWAIRNAFMLWAVRGDFLHSDIRQVLLTEDYDPPPAPPDVQDYVEPGESVSGRLPLGRRFPDLRKTLEETDVVFFWQFWFGGSVHMVQGCLIVPRMGSGSR
jgi:hypothetical protein